MAAWPQALDTKLWGTDGTITGIARSGNTIYVAGGFVLVGPNTGSFVPISRADGNIGSSFAKVAGTVRTAVSDAAGGWFLGGYFVGVGGLPRSGLAHVILDGTVSAWNPGQDGDVEALALHGDTLYVGGSFTHVGGAQRNSLAALDARTGKVLDWTPEPDGKVRALLVSDSTLLVGGEFSHIGGLDRNSLAELDLTSGDATAFNPNVTIAGEAGSVRTLVRMGDILYFGGMFALVGDQFRLNAAAIDRATSRTTDWNPRAANCNCNRYDGAPFVSMLVAGESSIYAAGHFSTIQFQDRGGLAELDLSTGAPTSWDPHNGPRFADYAPRIEALAVTDSTVYVGGGFDEIGGRTISYLAEVDRNTALATTWNPRPDFPPEILAVRGGDSLRGGQSGIGELRSSETSCCFRRDHGQAHRLGSERQRTGCLGHSPLWREHLRRGRVLGGRWPASLEPGCLGSGDGGRDGLGRRHGRPHAEARNRRESSLCLWLFHDDWNDSAEVPRCIRTPDRAA